MADMSQDEKRAAALRKLKKYQQHKTSSSSSSKSSKKKQNFDQSDENGEEYRLFTGFADSQKNGDDHCSTMLQLTDSEEKYDAPINTVDPTESLLERADKVDGRTNNINLSVDSCSYSNDTLYPASLQSSLVHNAVPVAANIFSSSYPTDANNFSDFFDNIKSSPDHNISNAFLTGDRTNELADKAVDKEVIVKSSVVDKKQLNTDESINESILENTEHKNAVPERLIDFQVSGSSHSTSSIDRKEELICGKANSTDKTDTVSSILQTNLASSAENLRQLSLELSGLIGDTDSSPVPPSTEMERRNQELASLLASEQQKCEKLHLQVKEYESQVCQLQLDLSQHKTEMQARLQRELSSVQEQLQLHVQTVGILVGEKAELEAAVSKTQQTAKQKAAEVEELQGRLKASRHRVSDLEREMSIIAAGNKHLESSSQQQSKELNRVTLEKEMMKKQFEETEEEAAEMRQNFDLQSVEVQRLLQELQEKQSQLDLAHLRVQQLSLSDTSDMERQLESLHQQKVGLEHQVAELQQTVNVLGSERDQANTQYQEYLHHVNGHLKSMADKLAAATAENEQLTNREQSLVKHLSELEKQLQQQQQQQQQRSRAKDSPAHDTDIEHLRQLEQNITVLQEEKEKMAIDFDNQLQENKVLQDQLDIYISKVEELETTVDSLKADQPDTRKLLEAMESDKVAAARAVGQNQKLKEQLGELQEGFIQMSNNKLDLTEQLQKEQHLTKELGERLAQQELEISELRTQLMENEKKIQNLQNNSAEQLSRQMLKQDQIADQMRHYEAQEFVTDALQNELRQYKEQCQNLHTENDRLRMQLAQASISEAIEATEDDQGNEVVESLRAGLSQLTMERDQLLNQLQEMKPSHKNTGTDAPDDSSLTQDVDLHQYSNLKEAMEKLEDRFTKTMEEVAELSDEKQRLEHLVLQLQGETETIGEYIALYQMQRSILRQRAQEKDEQLARLARDREEVKVKLNELNRLIGQLVAENGKETSTKASLPETVPEGNPEEQTSDPEGLINGDVVMKQPIISNGVQDNEDESSHSQNAKSTTTAKTADKIIALLSEIETSTLVEPRNIENFHPCPWCSGRLITV